MILSDEQSQVEARDYVLNRPLTRPTTPLLAPLALLLGGIAGGIAVGLIVFVLLQQKGAGTVSRPLIILCTVLLFLLCIARPFLILCVQCYQRYAPEALRRSCLCKPTCSEYATTVLKKYCLVKALFLIYIRLFRTCTGEYKVDLPYR